MRQPLLRSESGFSIVQAVIGMGIAAAAAMYMTQLNNQSMKAARNVSLMNDFLITTSFVAMSLNTDDGCNEMFTGAEIKGTKVTTQSALSSMTAAQRLVAIRPNGTSLKGPMDKLLIGGSEVAERDELRGGLKYTKLELLATDLTPPVEESGGKVYARYATTFTVEAEKQGNFAGKKLMSKAFPLTLLVDPGTGKVASCYGSQSKASLMAEVKAEVMADLGDSVCKMMGMVYYSQAGTCHEYIDKSKEIGIHVVEPAHIKPNFQVNTIGIVQNAELKAPPPPPKGKVDGGPDYGPNAKTGFMYNP